MMNNEPAFSGYEKPDNLHPIDRMENRIKRLEDALTETKEDISALCVGHPYAKVKWPHREFHNIINKINEVLNDK